MIYYKLVSELRLKRESGMRPVKLLKLKSLKNKIIKDCRARQCSSFVAPLQVSEVNKLKNIFKFISRKTPYMWLMFSTWDWECIRLDCMSPISLVTMNLWKSYHNKKAYSSVKLWYSPKLEGREPEMLLFRKILPIKK